MDEAHKNEIDRAARRAVREELNAEMGDRRYINLERVPLICQSIVRMDKNLEEMKENLVTKDQFMPVKIIAYGLVGTVLTSVLLTILGVVLMK